MTHSVRRPPCCRGETVCTTLFPGTACFLLSLSGMQPSPLTCEATVLHVLCPPQKEDKSVHQQLLEVLCRPAGSPCSSMQAFKRARKRASNICANVDILGDVFNFLKWIKMLLIWLILYWIYCYFLAHFQQLQYSENFYCLAYLKYILLRVTEKVYLPLKCIKYGCWAWVCGQGFMLALTNLTFRSGSLVSFPTHSWNKLNWMVHSRLYHN